MQPTIVLAAMLAVAGHAAAATPVTPVIDRIDNLELYELEESGDYDIKKLNVVYQVSPVPYDSELRHYRKSSYTAKADQAVFFVYASFDDSEDGGNTYGWVTDAADDLIAAVQDSGISALDGRHLDDWDTQNLGLLPLVLNPELDLSDAAATRAFVTEMVEKQEGKPVNPNGDADTHLEVYLDADSQPCQILGGRTLALCHVSYLQDRWNGTLTLWVHVQDGKGIAIVQAFADGNF